MCLGVYFFDKSNIL
ncbi:hypothetical protein D043_0697, partial [Vibrio parahaemolyticus EKP-021]